MQITKCQVAVDLVVFYAAAKQVDGSHARVPRLYQQPQAKAAR